MSNNFEKGKQAKMYTDISRNSGGTLNDPITVSN